MKMALTYYAVAEGSNNEIHNNFQDKMIQVLKNINNRREIILLRELNARTGARKNDPIDGRYGEDTLNNNEYRLAETCDTFQLKILDTNCTKKYTCSHRAISKPMKISNILHHNKINI